MAEAVHITEAAAQRVRDQLDNRGHGVGLRLAVKPSGCSGFAYVLDYVDEVSADDRTFEEHGVTVVVDNESLSVVDGVVIDFVRDGLNQVFRFENPNAADLCGCGESFSLRESA